MPSLKELILSKETASGEAEGKAGAHAPKIEVLDVVEAGKPFRVRISVGPHPMTPDHHISEITLYFSEAGRPFNPVKLASTQLAPGAVPEIVLKIRINGSGTLHALAYCTKHGLWESSEELRC